MTTLEGLWKIGIEYIKGVSSQSSFYWGTNTNLQNCIGLKQNDTIISFNAGTDKYGCRSKQYILKVAISLLN